MNNESNTKIMLEEYKALRNESLRSAQILSNTVWIAVSGFIITIGVFANAAKSIPSIVKYLPLLLCIQSLSATSMFLSETLKYARVGTYIREKIEKSLIQANHDNAVDENPMFWEHWITNKRVTLYYLSVIGLLQFPVFGSLLIFVSYLSGWNISPDMSKVTICDRFNFITTILIVIIDIAVVGSLSWKINKQKKLTI